jgi:hypothetical protein
MPFVRPRRSENGHDPVAQSAHDGAVKASHRRTHLGHCGLQALERLFGV